MKSVLMSIEPKYCELIATGKKTIEVRKTRPKIKTPFKCYIYCTLPKERFSIGQGNYACSDCLYLCDNKVKFGEGFEDIGNETTSLNGKVIGEFVCDKIDKIVHAGTSNDNLQLCIVENGWTYIPLPKEYLLFQIQLTLNELEKYSNGGDLYGWHISDLIIYDKPKELSEFGKECNLDCPSVHCPYWEYQRVNADEWDYDCSCNNIKPLTRPPQSWCYVEV